MTWSLPLVKLLLTKSKVFFCLFSCIAFDRTDPVAHRTILTISLESRIQRRIQASICKLVAVEKIT